MRIGTVLLIVLFNMSSFRASKVLVSLYAIELGASFRVPRVPVCTVVARLGTLGHR